MNPFILFPFMLPLEEWAVSHELPARPQPRSIFGRSYRYPGSSSVHTDSQSFNESSGHFPSQLQSRSLFQCAFVHHSKLP